MRQITLLTFFWCFSLRLIAQQSSIESYAPNLKGLDSSFSNILKTWHASGFAVAVISKKEIIYAKGFGYRDMARKLPVTPKTLFVIGSCTKAFTAAIVGQLQVEGRVDIDKPVTSILPTIKFSNDAMNNTVTLRDMMCHRTGLPRHDLSWILFNSSSTDSLVKRLQYLESNYAPRAKWQYNNFMFAALGYATEKITGKSWGENIRQYFFGPLDMSRSDINNNEMLKDPDFAIGYGLKNDTVIKKEDYFELNGMAAIGGINSCVQDMGKWLIAWINNGKYHNKQIIPMSYRNDAISSQSIVETSLPTKEKSDIFFNNYGFGWYLSSYRGHYRVEHGGNIGGFSASTCFFPTDSIGIVVLSNQDGSHVPVIVRDLVADQMLKLSYIDWNDSQKKMADQKTQEAAKLKNAKLSTIIELPPTHSLSNYEGSYSNLGYGTLTIKLVHDSLFAYTTNNQLWLRHRDYDNFEGFDKEPKDGIDTNAEPDIKVQFQLDSAGQIIGFISPLEPDSSPIFFIRRKNMKPNQRSDQN